MKRNLTALATSLLLALLASSSARAEGRYLPLPFEPLGARGQGIVDMEMEKYPELKLIAVHVTLRGEPAEAAKDRYIMFSSFGNIGKPDSDNDLAWFQSIRKTKESKSRVAKDVPPGTLLYRVTSHPKYAVQAPLLTKTGEVIGFLGIVFPFAEGDDLKKYDGIAKSVADEFQKRLDKKDDLYDFAD
ncbi:MAG: hypothetical protein JWM32_1042 [Verrucomicrobia bacterium]|nr:hypothetical protein [Verrucomicrobiota bacterium]